MIIGLIVLLTALTISGVAIYYSVAGLAAIFASAVIPITIMGISLEIGKLVTAVWLHKYWDKATWWLRTYLSMAVFVLMFITSMGIFGFLSKAHIDQTLVSGTAQAGISSFDEKIAYQRQLITTNQTLIKQLDDVVNQTMARTTDAKGSERALQIRRSQAADRTRLVKEIDTANAEVSRLSAERAPLASEARKVEAEVGPIKYIAEFIYGTRADQTLLEEAVRWVIIVIIFVFDPLAVLLLIASQYTFKWSQEEKAAKVKLDAENTIVNIPSMPKQENEVIHELVQKPETTTVMVDGHGDVHEVAAKPAPAVTSDEEPKQVAVEENVTWSKESDYAAVDNQTEELKKKEQPLKSLDLSEELTEEEKVRAAIYDEKELDTAFQSAKTKWKSQHPDQTLKMWKILYIKGKVDSLPWEEKDGYQQNSEQSENTLFNKLQQRKTQ